MGIHQFVKACFMEVDMVPRRKALDVSAVSFARIQSFAGRQNIMAHTGVVLLETVREENGSTQGGPTPESSGTYQATEFRSGQLSLQPFGLISPVCPFCKASNNVKYSANKGKVRFKCQCGAKSHGSVSKPTKCSLLEFPGIPSNHYLNPFPFPFHEAPINWQHKSNETVIKKFGWTGAELPTASSEKSVMP